MYFLSDMTNKMLSSFLNPDTSKFEKEAAKKIVSMELCQRINKFPKIKEKPYILIRNFNLLKNFHIFLHEEK